MGLESELRKMCLMQDQDDQHLDSVKDEWWSPMPFGKGDDRRKVRRIHFQIAELESGPQKKAA